jgi:hypothetical protein
VWWALLTIDTKSDHAKAEEAVPVCAPLVLCLARYTLLRVTRRSFDFAHMGLRMAVHT